MSVLLSVLIYLVIFGLLWYLFKRFPVPAPIPLLIDVVFLIALIYMVLSLFGIVSGGHFPVIKL